MNEYQPFATDPTARLMTQRTWDYFATVAKGWVSGFVQTRIVNKFLHDVAFLSEAYGYFVGATTGADMPDDGDAVSWKDKFAAAINAAISTVDYPVGSSMWFATKTIPAAFAGDGWIAADGRSLDRVADAAFFGVVGTKYGAADGTHYNAPDARGAALAGLDDFGTATGAAGRIAALNDRGVRLGSEKVLVTENQIPIHVHEVSEIPHAHKFISNADYDGRAAVVILVYGIVDEQLASTYSLPVGRLYQNNAYDPALRTSVQTIGMTVAGDGGDGLGHDNVQPTGLGLLAIKAS